METFNKVLEDTYRLCDELDQSGLGAAQEFGNRVTTKEVVRNDLFKYLLYLSGSDRFISLKEAEFIRKALNYEIEPDHMLDLIKENDLRGETFVKAVPACIAIAVKADIQLLMSRRGSQFLFTQRMIDLFANLGRLFIEETKEGASWQEREDYYAYMEVIEKFATEHLALFHVDISMPGLIEESEDPYAEYTYEVPQEPAPQEKTEEEEAVENKPPHDPVKTYLQKAYDYCDEVQANDPNMEKVLNGISLKEVLRSDISAFLLYLCAADGVITKAEADFINGTLGMALSPDEMRNIIIKNNLNDQAFSKEIPYSLQLILRNDNLRYRLSGEVFMPVSMYVMKVYSDIGYLFINADHQQDLDKISSFLAFMDSMKHFVKEHLEFDYDAQNIQF